MFGAARRTWSTIPTISCTDLDSAQQVVILRLVNPSLVKSLCTLSTTWQVGMKIGTSLVSWLPKHCTV